MARPGPDDSSRDLTEGIRFLPLAITRVDDLHGCVGALTPDGRWVRPEPTLLADIEKAASPYRYFHWASALMGPSSATDTRPEDRDLVGELALGEAIPSDQREGFLIRHLDGDVETAFSGERSLGLIRARIKRLYIKRSTGGRSFIRAAFKDEAGTDFDWIVPDIKLGDVLWPHVSEHRLSESIEKEILKIFGRVETFLTLGLTKPNHRFPGRFRGCHPLVVGTHTIPDYRDFIPMMT